MLDKKNWQHCYLLVTLSLVWKDKHKSLTNTKTHELSKGEQNINIKWNILQKIFNGESFFVQKVVFLHSKNRSLHGMFQYAHLTRAATNRQFWVYLFVFVYCFYSLSGKHSVK